MRAPPARLATPGKLADRPPRTAVREDVRPLVSLWVATAALIPNAALLITWVVGGPFELLLARLAIAWAIACFTGVASLAIASYLRNQVYYRLRRQHVTQLEELARIDELSGLYNYRYLRERLHAEAAETSRSGGTFALVLFDLDNFKDVNDRFGHVVGDTVITAIGEELRRAVGESGIAARQGGDEFAVLLPGAAREGAERLAAVVVSAIEAASLSATARNAHLAVSASSGIAVFPADADDIETLTAAADRALYASKTAANEARARTAERHSQDVFFAIGEALGQSLDPREVVFNLCQAVGTSLEIDACSIWLVQPNGDAQPRAWYVADKELVARFGDQQSAQPLTRSEMQDAGFLRPSPLYIDDAHDSALPARFRALLAPDTWMVSVPLEEPSEGMLQLSGRHTASAPPDTGLALAIGRLASAAIRNADTYQRARRQAEDLSNLAGLGGLLFGEGTFEERLADVTRRIVEITHFDMLTLDTADPTEREPFFRSFAGRSVDGGAFDERAAAMWRNMRPALTEPSVVTFLEALDGPLVLDDPVNQAPEMYRDAIRESGTRTTVVMPVIWQGDIKGLFYFSSYRTNGFDAHDMALMQSIAAQIAPAVQVAMLHFQLEQSYGELKDAHLQALFRLAYAAEARDPYTECHLSRIRALAQAIARRMGIEGEELEALGYGAIVHDLGKLRIPDSILINPGSLSDAEWAEMKKHPEWGAEIIGDNAFYAVAREVALCHHERWDGSGYPRGLAGEEIPLAARIVAVADVYDALTSARPYKAAWPIERALVELTRMRGRTLCPRSVDVFMDLWREGEVARLDAETEDESLSFDPRELYAA